MSNATLTGRQSQFLNEWATTQKPALVGMLVAGETLASAMDDYRGTLLSKKAIAQHDASAVDQIGLLVDMLGDAVGAVQKAADDLGIQPELIALDVSDLEAAHLKFKVRANTDPQHIALPIARVLARAAE